MPKVLDELVSKLKSQGYDSDSAYAIATAQLQKQGRLKSASSGKKGNPARKKSPRHERP